MQQNVDTIYLQGNIILTSRPEVNSIPIIMPSGKLTGQQFFIFCLAYFCLWVGLEVPNYEHTLHSADGKSWHF